MYPLIFRVVGILRPILLLISIRWLSMPDAITYVMVLSRYVICVEVYNVLFPTDGLYKKEQNFRDAIKVSASRLQFSLPVAALTILVLCLMKASVVQSIFIALSALLSATLIPFYSHFFPRLKFSQLAKIEISFHMAALASVFLWFATNSILFVLIFSLLEIPCKALCIFFLQKIGIATTLRSMKEENRTSHAGRNFFNGIKFGYPITFSNYFFRLPFAFPLPSGTIDPIFVLASQLSSAAYNVILVIHSDRLTKFIKYAALFSMALGIFLVLLVAYGSPNMPLQLFIVLCFTLPYSFWLSCLSGLKGLLNSGRYRLFLILGLNSILLLAAFVKVEFIWAAFIFPFFYFISLILEKKNARS